MTRAPRLSGRGRRVARCSSLIVAAQFGIFEAGLRTWGSSEAAPAFQGLFEDDPAIGYRLQPNARTRFVDLGVRHRHRDQRAGLRDDDDIGPSRPTSGASWCSATRWCCRCRCRSRQTFGELLEHRLNARRDGRPLPRHQRRRAGIRAGRGAAVLPQDRRAGPAGSGACRSSSSATTPRKPSRRQPQLHAAAAPRHRGRDRVTSSTRLRRLVRRSMVLQIAAAARRRRDRPAQAAAARRPEPPLQSYAAQPGAADRRGTRIDARLRRRRRRRRPRRRARRPAIVLMPARFQVDDADYGRLQGRRRRGRRELVRDAATERFDRGAGAAPAAALRPAAGAARARCPDRTSSSSRPST